MKSSIETKVAAAIGAAFIALTTIAVSQGNGERELGGSGGYGPTSNPTANTHISQQEYDSSQQPPLSVDAIQL